MSMSLPEPLLRRCPNPVFVETGTYLGGGLALALSCGFRRCYSVEVDPKFYGAAFERFAGDPRIALYLGDSTEILGVILKNLDERATLWLDAHPAQATWRFEECPLVQELEILACGSRKDHTILIDDRSYFQRFGTDEEEIRTLLMAINPLYKITIEDNTEKPGEIVMAVPPEIG